MAKKEANTFTSGSESVAEATGGPVAAVNTVAPTPSELAERDDLATPSSIAQPQSAEQQRPTDARRAENEPKFFPMKLKHSHIDSGVEYNKGDILRVDETTARWLFENSVAEPSTQAEYEQQQKEQEELRGGHKKMSAEKKAEFDAFIAENKPAAE